MSINVTRSSMPDFEEYCEEIRSLWDSHWLTNMGEKHIAFEEKLREYLGVDFLNLFTNGHLALEELIASFHFPKGGEVITTPFTFVSTTHAIVRNGLTPVFCDIDPDDFTLDPAKIEALITERTVAILPVHVYGNLCHVDEIAAIASRHAGNASVFSKAAGVPESEYNGDIRVIYDAAHTFGVRRMERASFRSENQTENEVKSSVNAGISDPWREQPEYVRRSACDYGDGAILSFHATKVFNTIEGGAAISHDGHRREVLDDLKNFGIRNPETCAYIGGNAKMSEFQAAMGICNLRHVDAEIAKRKAVYERYLERLGNVPGLKLWRPQTDVVPNYAYLPAIFEETPNESQPCQGEPQTCTKGTAGGKAERKEAFLRDRVWEALKAEGITARKYFWPLTSDLQCYRYLKDGAEKRVLPGSVESCKQGSTGGSKHNFTDGREQNITDGRKQSGPDGSKSDSIGHPVGTDTPIARRIASQVLTLPIYADLSMEDVDRICRIILETLKRPE